jgi:hypothetical protein
MKRPVFIIFSFILCVFASAGCKKKNPPSGGGLGGNATIIARVDHANALLDTAIVWIKYGTNNAPANGQYDDSMIVDTNYQAILETLHRGVIISTPRPYIYHTNPQPQMAAGHGL